MPIKKYVLLPNMDSDAPIYQTTADGQRVQIKKMPMYRPYLRMSFQDEDGISKVIRYKANAVNDKGVTVLDQREQIDKLKIEANEPFTNIERRDLEFKHGMLFTAKKAAQDYLEAYPAFLGFKGTCDEIREPQYKLLDDLAEAQIKNNDTRKRVKAANKVLEDSLEENRAMLIRLNGSFFETPKEKADCENLLMEFIDDAEEAGLDAVLRTTTTIDEDTTVLIGRLINEGLLSFDAIDGSISKKGKNGDWVVIREMSSEYSLDERKRLFSDFLNSFKGQTLKDDLESDLGDTEEQDNINEPKETEKISNSKPTVVKKRRGRQKKSKLKNISHVHGLQQVAKSE